jgi:hypothetical protein
MKSKNVFIPLFTSLLIVLFISCDSWKENKPAQTTTNNYSKIEEALKETNKQIKTAIYNGDYETLLKFHTDDIVIANDFHKMIKGKDALKEEYLKQKKEGVNFIHFIPSRKKCGKAKQKFMSTALMVYRSAQTKQNTRMRLPVRTL